MIKRHLLKHKFFTIINITGLAIGLSVVFYIGIFIINELSYEQMHQKASRIYRLSMHVRNPGTNYDIHWARVNLDWVNNLPTVFPEIKTMIRFQDFYPRQFRIGNDLFKVPFSYTADADVFDVFDFNLIRGNPATALTDPYSVVLTEHWAEVFFGDKDPVGKEIIITGQTGENHEVYKVTGVMEDLPANTHLPVNALTSFRDQAARTGWAYTYILLNEEDDAEEVTAKLPGFTKQYLEEDEAANLDFKLQPLRSIHLYSNLAREIIPNGDIQQVYLFAGVGFLILIMSTINYINLNAIQSLKRLREIGIKKALGSTRKNLTSYFLLEANIIVFLAAATGILLLQISTSLFDQQFQTWKSLAKAVPLVILMTLIVGTISGFFPAFVLSRAKALTAIKDKVGRFSTSGGINLKNILVAFQLTLCITLISSALITRSQFEYLTQKNLGLNQEQTLAITQVPDPVKIDYQLFKSQLLQQTSIKGVTATMEVPSREIRDSGPVLMTGKIEDPENAPSMDIQVVDHDFIELMDLKILAGKNFKATASAKITEKSRENLLDYLQNQPREYIINETALKTLGFNDPLDVINREINWRIGNIELQKGPIIGVVEDFHQETLKNQIEPVVIICEPAWIGNILVKLDGSDTYATLENIQKIWNRNFPEHVMEYSFLDDLYNQLYNREKTQLELIYKFSGLAVVIAFLGIFGLLNYTLKTREKELAIRKVLGASFASIAYLNSAKFLRLTLLGMLICAPFTWIYLEKWLQNYAYRIDIEIMYFLMAGVFVLTILFLTVIIQIHRLARFNLSTTLRSE